METLRELMARHHRTGSVAWIGLRPERRAPMKVVDRVTLGPSGLEGDKARPGKRCVTLVQAEHLPVISALCGTEATPQALRRNVVVAGINLAALRGRDITIGAARIRITGPCAPCSRMEETLGPGGYSAVRHHGGWCAEGIFPGQFEIGDAVTPC
ncbi:MOSC domain-containing protein [Jannaschia aquimarina]|uniref:MOSC domain protein n=1 Tax=Jannaschia aquimarina TaxID=935700 RepID=A0A0D1EFK3_9RHOB|nr:MOSC domain-containing protein [Jannaschia aquimarina]KIT15666.1 MOSC domain protein [Jannaschia aquimarina]SNT39398.1 MOSC domain-containing protein [Jannaschia aquimarina]